MIKILACQVDIPPTSDSESRDAHVARLEAVIGEVLAQQSVDLVVLPELTTIEYSRDSFGHLNEIAEDLDGPSCSAMSRLAKRHNLHVV